MEVFTGRGLMFRLAMITCLGFAMATHNPGWVGLAVAFAFASLAMLWIVHQFLQVSA
jgi:hypothetical protein